MQKKERKEYRMDYSKMSKNEVIFTLETEIKKLKTEIKKLKKAKDETGD